MTTQVAAPPDQVADTAATKTTVVLCGAAFMTMLDLFVVNVALESIGTTYAGASLAGLSWVLNAYIVVYAACLIPAGSLADRYGRKRGFVVGLSLFAIASAGCAAAPSLAFLIAFRVVQAVGAAALTPSSLGLILSVLPRARRAGAVKVWATTSSFAGALGPVVGGLLTQSSWRWIFLLNLPIGLVMLVAAVQLLPAVEPSTHTRVPDSLGAVAIALAVGAPSLGLVEAVDWGWGSMRMVLVAAVTVVALRVLVHRVRTHPVPVMPPRLFKMPSFTLANITILIFTSAFSAVFLSVSMWLETAAAYGPLQAGLALLPGPLAVPVFAVVIQRWAPRVPPRFVIAVGLAAFGLGSLLLALGGRAHYTSDALPGWIIIGVGIGIAMPTLIGASTTDLTSADAATGSAVVNTARQAGYALGVASIVAILGSQTAQPTGDSYKNGWLFVTALVLTSAATALAIRQHTSRNNENSEEKEEK